MIELSRVTKEYGSGNRIARVLDDVSLFVQRGEIAAVVGPSGAGKSTLAKCINLLVAPTSGSVVVNGDDLSRLRGAALRSARHSIGTVFQGSSLLRRRTAADNIALPLEYFGVTAADRARRVGELLEMVGLRHKATSYPAQLSGGQRQRVGIARALALRPTVLLADEATSGLDPATTRSILSLLRRVRDELDLSIVLITHEMDVVRETADTVWRLDHGRIIESGPVASILTDAGSALGEELLPRRNHRNPGAGQTTWEVVYGSSEVRADWPTELAARLHTPVGILAATIEAVEGRTVGRATIAVSSSTPDEEVHRALALLGLHGRPYGDERHQPARDTAAIVTEVTR